MSLWFAEDYIKKALLRWDLEDGKYWAREALKEIKEAAVENKRLKEEKGFLMNLTNVRSETELQKIMGREALKSEAKNG